ncbi:hypothetical protein QYF36_018131 [Acer negundo]|nr:hypothetical protein QYF36_018131 [Acer negundo]
MSSLSADSLAHSLTLKNPVNHGSVVLFNDGSLFFTRSSLQNRCYVELCLYCSFRTLALYLLARLAQPLATYPSTSHSLLFAIACAQKFRFVFPVSIIEGLLGKAKKDEKIDNTQLPKLVP